MFVQATCRSLSRGLQERQRNRRRYCGLNSLTSGHQHSFGPWLTTAVRRLHRNILTIALANKLARIALSVLIQGRSYETRIVPAAA